MGILPVAVTEADDPLAKDPFDDAAEVEAMYDQGGILTHGRLEENIDTYAGDNLGLPDPRDLKSEGKIKKDEQVEIEGFRYYPGGYSAVEDFPTTPMRPPETKAGRDLNFINSDALFGEPQNQQAWHSITSCKAPCNKDSGIGYPLANGPLKFDSGQLGYGTGTEPGRDDRLERVDARGRPSEGGQDVHLLLPDPSVHARIDPHEGREEERQREQLMKLRWAVALAGAIVRSRRTRAGFDGLRQGKRQPRSTLTTTSSRRPRSR